MIFPTKFFIQKNSISYNHLMSQKENKIILYKDDDGKLSV